MNKEEIIKIIREELINLLGRERYNFQKDIQIFDSRNIQLGRTTGTKIGTGDTEKLGFWGVTPVVRQNKINDPTGGATIDAQSRGVINEILDRLELIGINKSS